MTGGTTGSKLVITPIAYVKRPLTRREAESDRKCRRGMRELERRAKELAMTGDRMPPPPPRPERKGKGK